MFFLCITSAPTCTKSVTLKTEAVHSSDMSDTLPLQGAETQQENLHLEVRQCFPNAVLQNVGVHKVKIRLNVTTKPLSTRILREEMGDKQISTSSYCATQLL
jgi:hypothetical protein